MSTPNRPSGWARKSAPSFLPSLARYSYIADTQLSDAERELILEFLGNYIDIFNPSQGCLQRTERSTPSKMISGSLSLKRPGDLSDPYGLSTQTPAAVRAGRLRKFDAGKLEI